TTPATAANATTRFIARGECNPHSCRARRSRAARRGASPRGVARSSRSVALSPAEPPPIQRGMTPTLIRRLGKAYCAAGAGFYIFDEDLSRVLLRVAEFNRRGEAEASQPERREEAGPRAEATPKA